MFACIKGAALIGRRGVYSVLWRTLDPLSALQIGVYMLTKGSEWRRWDLHVHTPGTIQNDQFGSWDEYLDGIRTNTDVKVIGVTDYMLLENYSKLKAAKEAGKIPNIDLLIPNLEFRIAPPTEKATAVNLHFLISPEDPQHEAEISSALARLHWRYGLGNYSCVPAELMKLGRAFDATVKDDRAALRVGVTQYKVDFTALRNWFDSEPWLRRNALVAVSAGADGVSAFRHDGAWAALRGEITRFAQVIFSGRPGERDFWLGLGTPDDVEMMKRLGGPKPCIHGSDAHKMAELFRPSEDRFCWVKADTKFEGLRQVLYEPGDRVFIGPTPPAYHDEARVIRTVSLSETNGWFPEVSIPFNAGLVSIIGQKGSGKSALSELIAYCAGSWRSDDYGSFIERAGDHLVDLSIEIEWADGQTSRVRLGDEQSGESQVRYLSQKFVERLCAEDKVGSDLVMEIEAVIFSSLDPTDTWEASSFDELRAMRTEGIKSERERLQEDVVRLIREECELRNNANKLIDKRQRLKTLQTEKEGLVKQLPKPTTPEEARVQKDLQEKRTRLSTAQQLVAVEKQRLQRVADIRIKISTFSAQITRFNSELADVLKTVGIPERDWPAFRPAFSGDTETPLRQREKDLRGAIAQGEGDPENPARDTIRWLEKEVQELTQKESADKAKQERTKTIQARIAAIDTEATRLQSEIKRIEGPEQERLQEARNERLRSYVAVFKSLKREQEALEDLYAPIKKRLSTATSQHEKDLEFAIRWEADLKSWLARGGALFDQRKTIPYGTMQELGEAARRILLPAWTSGDPETIWPAMQSFLTEFRKDPFKNPRAYLRTDATMNDLLQWLYEVAHVRLTYGLKYKGVDLDKLSPGTKGIVLLILYLGMDTGDSRPLVVDQPDENLDNESIYSLLTTYFRDAKKRRQIILITHNPNMVVNGDSEQVIVASCGRQTNGLPQITYRSGALENASPEDFNIRHQVCQILEGGDVAFRKREQRYSLADR